MTHHFYDVTRRTDHTGLVERFVASPEPYSMAAYSVLNEALAVSFQLLAEKKLRSPAEYNKFISEDDNVYFDLFIAKVGQLNGQPCIRGMRLTVRRVVSAVAEYSNRAELLGNYPDLGEEDIRQALEFAAANLADEVYETSAA